MINMIADITETRLIAQFNELPNWIEQAIEAKIEELTADLLAMVEEREPVRTGRLRSQTYAYVDKNPIKRFIRGRVRVLPVLGINRTAAAFGTLEYGSPGTSGRRTGRVAVGSYRRAGTMVRKYTRRRPRITARRFLRGAAAVMIPRARDELERTLANTLAAAAKR